MKQTLMKPLAIFMAILMAALVALPMASAQGAVTTQFNVETPVLSPQEPITPDTGTATLTVKWIYSINTVAVGPVTGTLTGTAQLKWDQPSCTNNNVLISGALNQQVPFTAEPGTTTSVPGSSTFIVKVTQDAPGETPISCTINGRVLSPSAQVPQTPDSDASVPVTAAYLGLISANVPITIKQSGPQKEIRYDIEVTNLGNSRSYISFRLQSEDPGAGGWNPVPPLQVAVESQAQGGQETTKTVSFLVSTPFKNGWNNKDTTFLLDITPSSMKDPNKVGQTQTLTVLARVRGVYIPTLEPIFMLGAVVGAGLLARRFNE